MILWILQYSGENNEVNFLSFDTNGSPDLVSRGRK